MANSSDEQSDCFVSGSANCSRSNRLRGLGAVLDGNKEMDGNLSRDGTLESYSPESADILGGSFRLRGLRLF